MKKPWSVSEVFKKFHILRSRGKKYKIGWWSEQYIESIGNLPTCYYSTPDGREIEVCGIAENLDGINWSDKRSLGPVCEYLRAGRGIQPYLDYDYENLI